MLKVVHAVFHVICHSEYRVAVFGWYQASESTVETFVINHYEHYIQHHDKPIEYAHDYGETACDYGPGCFEGVFYHGHPFLTCEHVGQFVEVNVATQEPMYVLG